MHSDETKNMSSKKKYAVKTNKWYRFIKTFYFGICIFMLKPENISSNPKKNMLWKSIIDIDLVKHLTFVFVF